MLKAMARRLRLFLQADVMAELAVIRAEMARREELSPLLRQMESALLSIALGQENAAPHIAEPPPNP